MWFKWDITPWYPMVIPLCLGIGLLDRTCGSAIRINNCSVDICGSLNHLSTCFNHFETSKLEPREASLKGQLQATTEPQHLGLRLGWSIWEMSNRCHKTMTCPYQIVQMPLVFTHILRHTAFMAEETFLFQIRKPPIHPVGSATLGWPGK
jgi:hypothetical protein